MWCTSCTARRTTLIDGDTAFNGLLTDIAAVAYVEAQPDQLYVLSQVGGMV